MHRLAGWLSLAMLVPVGFDLVLMCHFDVPISPCLVNPAAGVWPWCSGRFVGGELCRSTAAELHVISQDPLFNLELYGGLGRWGMSNHAPYQQLVCEVPFCLDAGVAWDTKQKHLPACCLGH